MDLSLLQPVALVLIAIGAIMLLCSANRTFCDMGMMRDFGWSGELGGKRRIRGGKTQLIVGGVFLIVVGIVCLLLLKTI